MARKISSLNGSTLGLTLIYCCPLFDVAQPLIEVTLSISNSICMVKIRLRQLT